MKLINPKNGKEKKIHFKDKESKEEIENLTNKMAKDLPDTSIDINGIESDYNFFRDIDFKN